MGGKIVLVCLILSIHAASSIPTNLSSTTTKPASRSTTVKNHEFLSPKPPSSYEVTENVIDIPDDRTLSPFVTNFNVIRPINMANTSVNINKVNKTDTGDENNQFKRTSFTYVHFTKESEKNEEGGIKKLFRGIKDYVVKLKKGVVDGFHNYFHGDDKKKDDGFYSDFHRSNVDNKQEDRDVDFHEKFHRSYDSEEHYDDFEHGEFRDESEDYY